MTNDKSQIPNDKPQEAVRGARAPVTMEAAVWALVGVGALALRLARLGAAPLSAPEAREALLAWQAVTGQGMPGSTAYSPFLFSANALLFLLFGAADATARLWPAVFGAALVLTPLLFRRRVGRVGALGAGAYLALSPTALLASRQLDGAVVAAAGLMAALGGVVRLRETRERRWLVLSAAGLALALASSSAAYGLALVLILPG